MTQAVGDRVWSCKKAAAMALRVTCSGLKIQDTHSLESISIARATGEALRSRRCWTDSSFVAISYILCVPPGSRGCAFGGLGDEEGDEMEVEVRFEPASGME